jgi:hypothetical protein
MQLAFGGISTITTLEALRRMAARHLMPWKSRRIVYHVVDLYEVETMQDMWCMTTVEGTSYMTSNLRTLEMLMDALDITGTVSLVPWHGKIRRTETQPGSSKRFFLPEEVTHVGS